MFSHIGDEGFVNSCAGELLRYRKYIGAEHVKIFTDVKKKHRWVLGMYQESENWVPELAVL